MLPEITAYMAEQHILFCNALPFSACSVINPALLARTLPAPESVISLLIPYYDGDEPGRNLSLYAVARDYHLYARRLLGTLCDKLNEAYPSYRFVWYADHSPFDERETAAKAGLGFYGDNGLLINETYGSYVFLAEIATDMPFAQDAQVHKIRRCSHCGACRRACPMTDQCLSMVTQKKGELTDSEKAMILENDTVWGCDLCQTVCPYNRNVRSTPIKFFRENKIYRLTLPLLDGMSEEEFGMRAFAWRKRTTIRRNLILKYGSSGKALRSEDEADFASEKHPSDQTPARN